VTDATSPRPSCRCRRAEHDPARSARGPARRAGPRRRARRRHDLARARARDLGVVLPVTTDAPAAAGWGPTYVDAEGRPGRFDPCTPIAYVVNPGWAPQQARRDLARRCAGCRPRAGCSSWPRATPTSCPRRTGAAYQPQRYGDAGRRC
jgi:hypothetical protein